METSHAERKVVTITFTDTDANWKKFLGQMRTWSSGQQADVIWLYTAIEEAVEPREQGSGVEVPAYHLHDLSQHDYQANCMRCQAGVSDGPVFERLGSIGART